MQGTPDPLGGISGGPWGVLRSLGRGSACAVPAPPPTGGVCDGPGDFQGILGVHGWVWGGPRGSSEGPGGVLGVPWWNFGGQDMPGGVLQSQSFAGRKVRGWFGGPELFWGSWAGGSHSVPITTNASLGREIVLGVPGEGFGGPGGGLGVLGEVWGSQGFWRSWRRSGGPGGGLGVPGERYLLSLLRGGRRGPSPPGGLPVVRRLLPVVLGPGRAVVGLGAGGGPGTAPRGHLGRCGDTAGAVRAGARPQSPPPVGFLGGVYLVSCSIPPMPWCNPAVGGPPAAVAAGLGGNRGSGGPAEGLGVPQQGYRGHGSRFGVPRGSLEGPWGVSRGLCEWFGSWEGFGGSSRGGLWVPGGFWGPGPAGELPPHPHQRHGESRVDFGEPQGGLEAPGPSQSSPLEFRVPT